ncbi:MAG: AAA family ATPase [Deltaproteobacteria bacterium]|nr:AAA family ATPase [Deltaproteobacteria bacterium]
MYESFYGLRENPFNLTPDPKYLFLSHSHREALGHLRYGVEQRKGFVLITGGIGTGKTTLCRTFLQEDSGSVQSALIFNPIISEEELLQTINKELGVPYQGLRRKGLLDALNDNLIQQYSRGRTTVLIIDEAQNLDLHMMEKIRMLSNLETSEEKLIQIVLAGQPELEKLLQLPGCRQINERIAIRCRLRPLAADDIAPYIYHRLSVAGGRGDLRIAPDAMEIIHRITEGIPRRVNVLCDRALLIAYARESWSIDKKIICQARDETMCLPNIARVSSKIPGYARPAVTWAALALLMLTLAGIITGRIVVEWQPGTSSHGQAAARLGETMEAGRTGPILSEFLEEGKLDTEGRTSNPPKPSTNQGISPNDTTSFAPVPDAVHTEESAEERKTSLSSIVPDDLTAPSRIVPEISAEVSPQSVGSVETTGTETLKHPPDPLEWAGGMNVESAVKAMEQAWPFLSVSVGESGKGLEDEDIAVPAAIRRWARAHGLRAMAFTLGYEQIRQFRIPCVLEVNRPGSAEELYQVIESMDDGEYTFVAPDGRRGRAPLDDLHQIWSNRTIIFSSAAPHTRPSRMGSSGAHVRKLQAKLKQLGYPVEKVDGRFGTTTRKAVRQFQKDFLLKADGIPGPRSLAVLYQLEGHGADSTGDEIKAPPIKITDKPVTKMDTFP